MTHALERTSPLGQPFVGKCMKCGMAELRPAAAIQECPADNIMSDEAALLRAIDPDKKGEDQ